MNAAGLREIEPKAQEGMSNREGREKCSKRNIFENERKKKSDEGNDGEDAAGIET